MDEDAMGLENKNEDVMNFYIAKFLKSSGTHPFPQTGSIE